MSKASRAHNNKHYLNLFTHKERELLKHGTIYIEVVINAISNSLDIISLVL